MLYASYSMFFTCTLYHHILLCYYEREKKVSLSHDADLLKCEIAVGKELYVST